MCARYTFFKGSKIIADEFGATMVPDLEPRYNIAPSQLAPAVIHANGERQFRLLTWGLVPSWVQDLKTATKPINARIETLSEKPSFRTALRRRRCLIPADGYYEWTTTNRHKQPYYFARKDGKTMAFAGLWEEWEGWEGVIESFTIVTTGATGQVAEMHDRMPAMLDPEYWTAWLDPKELKTAEALAALQPRLPELEIYPVCQLVGKPQYDSPELIARIPSPTLF